MPIGISGAGGQLGAAVIARLIEDCGQHALVGISRSRDSIEAPIEKREGDFDRPETLANAYVGLDRLLLIPSPDLQPGVRGKQLVSAIDAAVASGVGHMLLLSSVLADPADEPDAGAAFWRAEQHLKARAASWTILRMNYYAETFVQWAQMWLPSGLLPGLAENDIAFVSRSDVAIMASSILASEGHDGATYHATGAQAFSGQARAALIARSSGKPFAFERFAEDEFKARLIQSGMPNLYANGVLEIERHSVAGSYNIVTDDMEQLTGRAPQALASIVHSLLRPENDMP